MHIVMVTDYYLPTLGGIQTSIKAQKEELEKAGHRVTILCPLHEPSKDPNIVRLPTFKYIKPDGYPLAGPGKKVVDAARTELEKLGDVDIVHVHSDMAAGVGGLLSAKALGIPVVQSMHGREDMYAQKILPLPELTSVIPSRIHNKYISHGAAAIDLDDPNAQTKTARRMWRLMVSHANYADHVVVPSKHFAAKLQKHGVYRTMTILSNGIEESVLAQLNNVHARVYEEGTVFKLMWCGRVSPEKRPIEFLQAIKLFPKNVHVDMYGDGVSMKEAQRFVRNHKLNHAVTLHGGVSQKEVLGAMSNHHAFISTSYNFDNQPMVLLEAIGAGLPVLYCDPDMGEIVPAEGSILTKNQHPQGINGTIQTLLAEPKRINRMSEAMLDYRDEITQTNHLNRLLKVYRETIKSVG